MRSVKPLSCFHFSVSDEETRPAWFSPSVANQLDCCFFSSRDFDQELATAIFFIPSLPSRDLSLFLFARSRPFLIHLWSSGHFAVLRHHLHVSRNPFLCLLSPVLPNKHWYWSKYRCLTFCLCFFSSLPSHSGSESGPGRMLFLPILN